MGIYANRRYAGQALAAALKHYAGRPDLLVLALPRGGVPVAYEVARRLAAPLDVFVVRKLGAPGHEELAMGAVASGGLTVLNEEVVAALGISREQIAEVVRRETGELSRRERAYRGARPAPDISGRTVILIDDGLATGYTMRAAIEALRQHHPGRIVVAVPVGSPEGCAEMAREADEMICAKEPQPFFAVGSWYTDFSQTTDEEVRQLLHAAGRLSRVNSR